MSDLTTENITPGADTQATESSPVAAVSTETSETNTAPNASVETGQSTESTTETASADTTTTESQTQTDTAALQAEIEDWKKKAENFEGMGRKWKSIAKDLKSQMREAPTTTKTVEEMTEWERIEQMFDDKLAKLTGFTESQQEQQVIDETAELPYTKELGPEIKVELDEIKADAAFKNVPYKRKLELARSQAIAKNVHIIAEISEGRGLNKAYEHQTVKQTVAGPTGTSSNASVVSEPTNILDRIKSMTREEYLANRDEIEAATLAAFKNS